MNKLEELKNLLKKYNLAPAMIKDSSGEIKYGTEIIDVGTLDEAAISLWQDGLVINNPIITLPELKSVIDSERLNVVLRERMILVHSSFYLYTVIENKFHQAITLLDLEEDRNDIIAKIIQEYNLPLYTRSIISSDEEEISRYMDTFIKERLFKEKLCVQNFIEELSSKFGDELPFRKE